MKARRMLALRSRTWNMERSMKQRKLSMMRMVPMKRRKVRYSLVSLDPRQPASAYCLV